MAPRMSLWPRGGPTQGGTAILVRLDGDESWTPTTVITVVFGTRIRRIPVTAKLGQGGRDFVTCTCVAPRWGEQETVHVILIVNKVEAASASFFFFLPPRTLLAKPDMARCSQKTNITLSGENFPGAPGRGGAGGILPVAGETVDVRLVAESGEPLSTQKGTVGLGTVTVELGGIAMTGAVHFEVSVNGADFDKSYSEWQEQVKLLSSSVVQRQKAAPEIEQLNTRMQKASVVLWENPLLTAIEPGFCYIGTAVNATLSCTGYPVVETGSVVVNLAERDLYSREYRFNHDVAGEVDVASNTIQFVTPKFQQEKRHPVDVEVCVSLDGGRTFSAVCPQQLRVRKKPFVGKVSPLCGPCVGGTTVSILGEALHAQDLSVPILVRFKGQLIDRRVEALSVRDADEVERDDDASKRGWMEVTCVAPRMKELEKAGVVPLQVSLSMDGGESWAVWEGGLFRVFPPLTLSHVKPKTVVMAGGTPLFVYGAGIFQTATLAVQIAPAGDQEVALAYRSAIAPAKFHSVKQAAVCNSPKLAFTGPAMVLLTLNGQQWYSAPDIIHVRSKPVEPLTRQQIVEKEKEKEKERLKRIRERAEKLGSTSQLPAGMAVREAITTSVAKMVGVGVTLGRNSRGEHCVKDVRKGCKAREEGLREGDVVAAIREVRGTGEPEEGDLVYLSRDVESIYAAVLLRGPAGTVLGLVLADGREIQLKRQYADREGSQEEVQTPRATSIRGTRASTKSADGKAHKDGAEPQYHSISRASLLRSRKHYEKLQVPGAKKGKLRELSLAGIGEVTQWTVVCALLTQRSVVTSEDLERFGVELPAIAQIAPKKPLQVTEHPRSRAKEPDGDRDAMPQDRPRSATNGGRGVGRTLSLERASTSDDGAAARRTQLQLELPNGARYEGESVMGVAEGRGEMRFANGDAYRGDFVGGSMHGDGEWAYVNGDVYKGRFQNGVAEGQGRFEGAAGDVYEGSYASNRPHGWGVKLWANGCRYEGEWKRGKEHGTGLWSVNGDRYEGSFRNGVPHGEGRFVKANGDMYQGEWRDGKQHGRGAYFGRDGEVYDGEWTSGRISRAGLHKRKKGRRGKEDVLGTYTDKWEDEEDGEPHVEVLQRIRDRELRDDDEGFLRAVGKVFRERVQEYLRAGVDINTSLPLQTFSEAPWWRPPLQGLKDLNVDNPDPEPDQEASVTAVEVLCMVWVALETGRGDPGAGRELDQSGSSAEGGSLTLAQSVSGVKTVSRGMLVDMLKELLAAGADPTPAMVAAASNGEVEAARLLVECGGVRPAELSLSVRTLVDIAQATLQMVFLEGLRSREERARQLVVYLEGWEEGDEEEDDEVETPRGAGGDGWRGSLGSPGAGREAVGEWATADDEVRARELLQEVESELPPELTAATGRRESNRMLQDVDGGAEVVHMAGADTEEAATKKLELNTTGAERHDLMLVAQQSVRDSVEIGLGHDLNYSVVVVVDEVQLDGALEDTVRKMAHGRGRVSSTYLGMEMLTGNVDDGQEDRWWSHDLPPAAVLLFHHEMVIDLHPDTAAATRQAVVQALGPGGEDQVVARVMLCGGLDAGPLEDEGDRSSESGREELDAIELAGCEVDLAREGRMAEGAVQQLPLRDGDGDRIGLVSLRVVSDKALRAIRVGWYGGGSAQASSHGSPRAHAAATRPPPMPFENRDRWVPGVGVADSILEPMAGWRGHEGAGDRDLEGAFESWEVRGQSKRSREASSKSAPKAREDVGARSGGVVDGSRTRTSTSGGRARDAAQKRGAENVAWASVDNARGGGTGKERERKQSGAGHAKRGRDAAEEVTIEDVFDELYLGGGGFLG